MLETFGAVTPRSEAAALATRTSGPVRLGDVNVTQLGGALLFGLSEVSIRIVPDGGTGMGDQLRAAAFDEIVGFGDDVLQDIEHLAHAGFPDQ